MRPFIIIFMIVIIFFYFYGYYKYYLKNKYLPKCDVFYIKEDTDLVEKCDENLQITNYIPENYDNKLNTYYKLKNKINIDIEAIFANEKYLFDMNPKLTVKELINLPQIKSFIRHGISDIERDSSCDDIDKFDYYGDGDYEFNDINNDNMID